MRLNLKTPLAFFDLETTGTNIAKDRIIEIAIVKIMPNGDEFRKVTKVNPEMPIPLETSLIHGIYDEDVKDAPTFKSIAKNLAKFLEGCDFAGFNVIRFDVPLLVEEFLRAGINFDISKCKLVDAQKIFHLMEKRTLAAALKFYCDKDLIDAHSAEADTVASMHVLQAQIVRYAGEPVVDMQGNTIGVIENNMETLHNITATNLVDLAGRIILNDDGVEVFNFGKHKLKPVVEVFSEEPSYYDWMMKGDFPLDTKRKLTEIKLRGFNNK